MNKVTIKNSGHSFDVRPSQTVLAAAIDAGINLPYGCRNGACGSCKAKLVSGKVMHNDYQSSAMSDAELAAGNTLLCCAMALEDLEIECKKIDNLIDKNGGLDLILLGIGTNGHLAMNEPGTPFNSKCHVSKLADSTISTGQKYFKSSTPLSLGITVGLKHISNSKEIILMANGSKKAEIIHKTIHSKPDISLPSSILSTLNNVSIMLDNEAASLLV